MDTELVKVIATQIVDQQILHNWEYWLLLGGIILLAGAASSLLGSYFAKQGEIRAEHAQQQTILDQLSEVTRVTAQTNSVVALGEWSERERRTLLRTKLEEMVLAAYAMEEWLTIEMRRRVIGSGHLETSSPLPKMIAVCRLYFVDLFPIVKLFADACLDCHNKILDISKDVVGAPDEAAKSKIRDIRIPEYHEAMRHVLYSELAIDRASAAAMGLLMAVPSAGTGALTASSPAQ